MMLSLSDAWQLLMAIAMDNDGVRRLSSALDCFKMIRLILEPYE
jgi:hypothetical protein